MKEDCKYGEVGISGLADVSEEGVIDNVELQSISNAIPITRDFGFALNALREGLKVQRSGWNGKGMYLVYKPGYPDGVPANEATAKAHGIEVGTIIEYCPYIEMKTADNKLVPWLASQTDILATDWQLVD